MTFTIFCYHTQVISKMRVLMTEDSNNAVSNSFLLDDDSRLALSSSYWTIFLPYSLCNSCFQFHFKLYWNLRISPERKVSNEILLSIQAWINFCGHFHRCLVLSGIQEFFHSRFLQAQPKGLGRIGRGILDYVNQQIFHISAILAIVFIFLCRFSTKF